MAFAIAHLLSVLLLFATKLDSLPLATSGRFIVDVATGRRVKLRCANWAGHLEPIIPEGLNRRPLSDIASLAATYGFNCVRLTWATHAFTDPRRANLTVAESLRRLGLREAAEGVERNNGWLAERKVAEAFDAVVEALWKEGVMTILDNHVSEPMWCCGIRDGNGFFGDRYFDGEEWLTGLRMVATRYRALPQVVGMSLRNELRGPNQSEPGWYEYVTRGIRTINEANRNLLVIVSGLNYDSDLSFLSTRPLPVRLDKIVYEAHWYAFSVGRREEWKTQSPTHVCPRVTSQFLRRIGFVLRLELPLFVSEFGIDQRGTNVADNRYLVCFLAFAADTDIDWAIWSFQGSYYVRNRSPDFAETYAVLDPTWRHLRNPNFLQQYGLMQIMLQDPTSGFSNHQIIYHPLSGLCLQVDGDEKVHLGDCNSRSRWIYASRRSPIQLMGTDLCLRMVTEGDPVTLAANCERPKSEFQPTIGGGYQLAGMDRGGKTLCLHWSSGDSSMVVAKECVCVEGSACQENPQVQWFIVVSSNATPV